MALAIRATTYRRRRNALQSARLPSSEILVHSTDINGAAALGKPIGVYRDAAGVQPIPRAPRRPVPHRWFAFSGVDVVLAPANGPRASYISTIVGALASKQDWSVATPTTDQAPRSGAPKINRSRCLTARGLTKDYVMGEVVVHALSEVDLEIYAGELVVLLGPSGSGKSTLLNILGGLDTPTRGSAFWNDHDLGRATEAELTRFRRDHVGFVFQFYNLIPSLTVRENVALVTEIASNPDEAGGSPRVGGAFRAARSLSRTALRRGAAAGGHCACHSQAA